MKFKLNPLTGEFDYTSESANKQKLNPLTWEFNLVEGDGPFSQIFNPLNWKLNLGVRGGGWIIVEVTGNWYINLTRAMRNKLLELKAYWWTEQSWTPTPDNPIDIVSNNGVVKVSPNLFDKNASYALFDGYLVNASVGQNTTLSYYTGGDKTILIKVVPNTTYTVTRATNLGSVYDRIRCAAFTTLPSGGSIGVILYNLSSNRRQANATFTTLSDTQYVAINVRNTGAVGDDWTQFVDAFQLEKGSTATPYKPYGQIYTDWTVETINIHGKNLFDDNTAHIIDEYTEIDGRAGNIIHVSAGTYYAKWNVSGASNIYYRTVINDTISGYTTIGEAGRKITMNTDGEIIIYGAARVTVETVISRKIQLEAGDTATEYKPYFDGWTATAEMLLKVGDYVDEQEILSWNVTRKVGVKVLDWTEDWAFRNQTLSLFYATIAGTYFDDGQANHLALSTHFLGVAVNNPNMPDNSCKCASLTDTNSLQLFIKSTNFASPEDIKSWLADQYNAWTPVIVLYPLATPTTETVAGQTMNIPAGDSTIEITQASIDNLWLYAKYLQSN